MKVKLLKLLKNVDIKNKIKFNNPYGDGMSSLRIIKLIKKIDLTEKIIQKQITY